MAVKNGTAVSLVIIVKMYNVAPNPCGALKVFIDISTQGYFKGFQRRGKKKRNVCMLGLEWNCGAYVTLGQVSRLSLKCTKVQLITKSGQLKALSMT